MKLTMQENILQPILKYPGGKLRELPIIKRNLPKKFRDYYEPFVGGGSTWLNVHANHYYINDLSTDLMNLYHFIKSKDNQFLEIIKNINKAWTMSYMAQIISTDPYVLISDEGHVSHFINSVFPHLSKDLKFIINNELLVKRELIRSVNLRKDSLNRIKKNDGQVRHLITNEITTVKATIYTLLRTKYNTTHDKLMKTAIFWYLREYCYSSMFRFNSKGEFNVPFGGSSYNNKLFISKLYLALSQRFQRKLSNTTLSNADFLEALKMYEPEATDFVFLDPPYDTVFSTYDGNKFDEDKQIQLAEYLKTQLKAKFMLIIKSSKLINRLYRNGDHIRSGKSQLRIIHYDKQYQVSFQNRNNKDASHLLIMNY